MNRSRGAYPPRRPRGRCGCMAPWCECLCCSTRSGSAVARIISTSAVA